MHCYKVFRASSLRILALLLIVAVLLPAPAFSLDSEDSQIFISGFNAYQRKDYGTAITDMSGLLKRYPDTSLRDMALFWLARAYYKTGNQQEAAKYMAQFYREYPQSPLKGTVLPLYYGNYDTWRMVIKNGMRDVRFQFDSNRMAHEYYELLYKSTT